MVAKVLTLPSGTHRLTLSTMSKIFCRRHIEIFFSYFLQKTRLDISGKKKEEKYRQQPLGKVHDPHLKAAFSKKKKTKKTPTNFVM